MCAPATDLSIPCLDSRLCRDPRFYVDVIRMDSPQTSQSINNHKQRWKDWYHDVWAGIQDPLFNIHRQDKGRGGVFQSVKWFYISQYDIVRCNLEANLGEKRFKIQNISFLLVRNVPYFISFDLDISTQSQINLLSDVTPKLQKVLIWKMLA